VVRVAVTFKSKLGKGNEYRYGFFVNLQCCIETEMTECRWRESTFKSITVALSNSAPSYLSR
jgi:hypothetical protein